MTPVSLVIFTLLLLTLIVCGAPNHHVSPEPGKLNLIYNTTHTSSFRELDHGIQYIGNDPSNIKLSCQYSNNPSTFIHWNIHGFENQKVKRKWSKSSMDENGRVIDLEAGPPVIRIECYLEMGTETLSNTTLIYTGAEDKQPYLYKHGEVIRAVILNGTKAILPCLLSFPLEHTQKPLQLQLFKDDNKLDFGNGISYTPELGYILDLNTLQNPHGSYECRVINSTLDDFVAVEFDLGSYISVKYTGGDETFDVGSNTAQPFECKLPINIFEPKFEWFYLLRNGLFSVINPESVNNGTNSSSEYSQTASFTFQNGNIAEVGCVGTDKTSRTRYNNTYQVELKGTGRPPNIVNEKEKYPLIYKPGMRLSCATTASPAYWEWLKDGLPTIGSSWQNDTMSVLTLNPFRDETDVNYTCVVSNEFGPSATHSFRVIMDDSNIPFILIALGILAAAIIAVLLTTRNIKTPTLSESIIDWFNNGTPLDQEPLLSEEEQEPETVPYLCILYNVAFEKRIQDVDDLKSGEKLGSGAFGTVIKAYLKEGGKKFAVAIKIPEIKSVQDKEALFMEFLAEIKRMQFIQVHPHDHVLKFIGANTADIRNFKAYLIVEYCAGGDMKSYLTKFSDRNDTKFYFCGQKIKPQNNYGEEQVLLRTGNLMVWCEQVAGAMDHIARMRLVHRDLAARNILLASTYNSDTQPNNLVAKVGDFGHARLTLPGKLYYETLDQEKAKKQIFPVQWYAPEVLKSRKFSTESDRWSLGVLFWEIFTLGKLTPFKELSTSEQLAAHLQTNGSTLTKPPQVKRGMWEIIQKCWRINPADRPTFAQIHQDLKTSNRNRVEPTPNRIQIANHYAGVVGQVNGNLVLQIGNQMI